MQVEIYKGSSFKAQYNQEFAFFVESLSSARAWFLENGEAIHQDRNVLKRFDSDLFNGLDDAVVVKSFKIPNPVSRLIYSFFRPSKAKRSFRNSVELVKAGFSVPSPLAYIEFFNAGLLRESFYFSREFSYGCTLHEVYRKQMFEREDVLPLVVKEAYKMHQSGFLHRDFSHGNVLVSKKADLYTFAFVDLNRLYKGKVSFEFGLKSLVRLATDERSTEILAEHYALCAGRSKEEALKVLNVHLYAHKRQKALKQKIKKALGISRD